MLADFDITIHSDPKRTVRVKIHENVVSLRSAATQYENRRGPRKKKKKSEPKNLLGICHRFHNFKDPLCAIVRLAPPHLGVGIISHELAHAVVWIWEIDHHFKDVPLTCQNDEEFCWNLGELIQQTVNVLYKNHILPI